MNSTTSFKNANNIEAMFLECAKICRGFDMFGLFGNSFRSSVCASKPALSHIFDDSGWTVLKRQSRFKTSSCYSVPVRSRPWLSFLGFDTRRAHPSRLLIWQISARVGPVSWFGPLQLSQGAAIPLKDWNACDGGLAISVPKLMCQSMPHIDQRSASPTSPVASLIHTGVDDMH